MDNKNKTLKDVLSKVLMRNAKEKRDKKNVTHSVADSDDFLHPFLYISSMQLPELKGKEVKDDVKLIIDCEIVGHNLRESRDSSEEKFDLKVNKIGIID